MIRKNKDAKPGFGKLLDAWVAPDSAGDPIGCLATSFTFSPVLFEEECLARFLQLESDPSEDGPVYLVEREEKLAQLACAAAFVDQRHCRGSRSLRWDLISARLPQGLQHSKVSLLYWSNLVRLIIGSANLTEDGYRRNLEVFGVVDFCAEGNAPISCLLESILFLRQISELGVVGDVVPPPVHRWRKLLDRIATECSTWGVSDQHAKRQGNQVLPIFSRPGVPCVFERLNGIWPGGSPPEDAYVVSPFFDPPETENVPAKAIWDLLRQRGNASVEYFVSGEDVPGEETVLLHAPKSLIDAQPSSRASVSTTIQRVLTHSNRPLHAKGIWIEDSRWSVYLMGSSNFSSAGLGLSRFPNYEANLAYIIDSDRLPKARGLLDVTFPEGELIHINETVKWKPRSGDGEDEVGDEILLPSCYGDVTFDLDSTQHAVIRISITGVPPLNWELITDGDSLRFWGESEWHELGRPQECTIPWPYDRPPSGFWVRWQDSYGSAWWPVNVFRGEVLPPPDELRDLPLEVLINILSSARPLHRVLKDYLHRRQKMECETDSDIIVDPHKRVDASQFLLQRTRRISWALNALRTRLERPVATIEFLRWRLCGPVGVLALAQALVREARSEEEKAFLLSELALELGRVKPEVRPGCIAAEVHRDEIKHVINEIHGLVPEIGPQGPLNLKQYVSMAFQSVLS